MSVQVERRWFNVDEYYRMAEAGILAEDDRVELIEGEIIKMVPIGSRHAACVDRINRWLNRYADRTAIIRVQNPIRLDEYSEPQPDIVLLHPRDDFYAQAHPGPKDVLLLIEVIDSSSAYDRGVKLPLYARAGIREVWLVNVQKNTVEMAAEPVNDSYQKIRFVRRGEVLESATNLGLAVKHEDIFG